MDLKLEVVVVPVSDVDRAKDFYKRMGMREDIDFDDGKGYRVVQLTPPGSIDSLVLAVTDIEATRRELGANGVDVGDVFHDAGGGLGGGFVADPAARAAGPDPQRRSYATYARLEDPDGNVWTLQELTERLPGRV
jgi:catechol 2,3-dioxygenase-like lactoylglutathione lyase family enzyme